MKKKKREEIVEVLARLAMAKPYAPADLGADVFRRTGTQERTADMRCILVSTDLRNQLITLLGERL